LEVVRLASTPTHHVVHKDGSAADIYITPTQQRQLNNTHSQSTRGARASVCIHFREACINEFGEQWGRKHRHVKWSDITLTPITHIE